ncbi:hypothetical protein J2751_002705 [Halorubrum alkaliphilum]|uniref:Uncharacterized protein n=1 Tax=Halorubrum alkaliphilum TaxID=261290 RepID=A0A8T4GJ94_9EURY|nr:hypothetical protein [Halorubrum alkaliphilum]MBP1923660.1 hypothetical protein [Halorubrum alkaliphilum]
MTPARALAPIVVALVLVTLLIGLGSVSVGGDTDDTIYIQQPGTPTDLVSGDRSHTISDLYINTSNSTLSDNKLRLSIDLSPLSDRGVNTSQTDITDISIDNGAVDRVERQESTDGDISIQLVVEKTGSDDLLRIEQIELGDISTEKTGPHSDVRYQLAVTGEHKTAADEPFINEAETTVSKPFDIVDGSLQFRTQATISSNPSGFMRQSVTVEDVHANTNTTLFVTYEVRV